MTKEENLNVSVTSRAAEDNVLWILNHLRSHPYQGLLGKITYLPITNRNREEWKSEVEQASIALLYHTKCHGRINITDVTDSLYDAELQHLSDTLGRQNVMVLVGDLEKSDDEERDRILQSQPSISRWAGQLLLFTDKEKNPVPETKQKVLLDTFRAAQQKKEVPSLKREHKVLLGIAVGFITVLFGRMIFRRKRSF